MSVEIYKHVKRLGEHKTLKSLIHEPQGRDGDFLSLISVDLLSTLGKKTSSVRLTAVNRAELPPAQQRWTEIY